jgi:hypothetical protein
MRSFVLLPLFEIDTEVGKHPESGKINIVNLV